MNHKQWFESKTFYFNLITIGIGIAELIGNTYPIDPQVLTLIIGIGNLILRVLSDKPIAIGKWSLK